MPLASRYALARQSGRGVGLRVGVEQADGLDVGLNGEHHIHDGLGVQCVGRAGDIVNVGQVCGGGVGDGRVDDRGLGGLGGGGHALGGQRRDGNDGVIAVGDDLCADLVQRCGVVLPLKSLYSIVMPFSALGASSFSIATRISSRLAWSSCWTWRPCSCQRRRCPRCSRAADAVVLGGRCGGVGGIGSEAAGGQAGHHGGGGQNSNKLFHGKFSLICKL